MCAQVSKHTLLCSKASCGSSRCINICPNTTPRFWGVIWVASGSTRCSNPTTPLSKRAFCGELVSICDTIFSTTCAASLGLFPTHAAHAAWCSAGIRASPRLRSQPFIKPASSWGTRTDAHAHAHAHAHALSAQHGETRLAM